MTQYVKVNGIGNLPRYLRQGQKNIRKAIDKAIWSTAQQAVKPIRKRVPVAFGELRESIQAFPRGMNGNPVTSVDAPHAGAVEQGSLPHVPDFERLLAWVKLRGLQGLNRRGSLRKRFPAAWGGTTPGHARDISAMIKALSVRGKKGVGRHLPADAAVTVTKAISKAIEQRGTRPHWFVRESLSDIQQILKTEMAKEMGKIKG